MKIINVIMTATQDGCPEGTIVRTYDEGTEYNLPESLANVFINDLKVAEEVIETVEDDLDDDELGDEKDEDTEKEKKPTRASRKAAK